MATDIELWENPTSIAEIKEAFAPKLTNIEFNLFINLGRATGLNPFLKEIWAISYGNNPAQIFIGRDGYRKGAQRHPAYDYHQVDAVYSNDEFEMINGQPHHKYKMANRGVLAGAYCIVQRKGSSKPCHVFVEIREYAKPHGVWKEKPATMIKKVAEAQGLRMGFQELFAGTYDESEAWDEKTQTGNRELKNVTPPIVSQSITNKEELKRVLKEMGEEYENVTKEDLAVIGSHLMTLSLSDFDIPLAVREELDSKFQRKV